MPSFCWSLSFCAGSFRYKKMWRDKIEIHRPWVRWHGRDMYLFGSDDCHSAASTMLLLWIPFNKARLSLDKIPDGSSMLNSTRRISIVLYLFLLYPIQWIYHPICLYGQRSPLKTFACPGSQFLIDRDCLYFWRLYRFFRSLWLYLVVLLSVLMVLGSTWLIFNCEGSRSLALITSSHLGCFFWIDPSHLPFVW